MPSTPSNEEQLLLELINRFRANPAQEASLLTGPGIPADIADPISYFGVSVSAFTAQLAALNPVAPVAWNGKLADSADGHNAAMIANDVQSHQLPGEPGLGARASNAGYTTYSNLGENVYLYAQDALNAHAAFIIDWGYDTEDYDGSTLRSDFRTRGDGIQDPPGHRVNLINGTYTEVGVSIVAENDPNTDAGPVSVTQDFGARFDYQAQFVGVVINDLDHDHFYDIGEGLGGVTVTLQRGGNTYTTTSWSSGGYQIAVPAGTYTITFSGGGLTAPVIKTATLGTSNVEVSAEATGAINYVDQQITAAYLTYGGRVPTSAELTVWENALGTSGNYGIVKDAILHDPLGRYYVDQQIIAAYQTYGGRAPTSGELTVWENALGTSGNYGIVRDAILHDPLGRYYVDQQIIAAYQTYGGRAPTSGELTVWENALGTSGNYGIVKDAILHDPLGRYYVDQQIIAAYQTYGGRAPTSGELTVWENALGTSGNYGVVKDAILGDPLGKAYVDAQINIAYQTYGGRNATTGELRVWEGALNGNNHDFTVVRTAILNDPLGINNSTTQIAALYQRYFQRAPSANEQTVWHAIIRDGKDFDVLRDALMSDGGSGTTTTQSSGTGATDTFHFATKPYLAISGFDPANDVIDVHGLGYASINPLDTAHARQIHAYDGTPDVLITLDASHEILLHGVTLSQLGGANFLL